MNPDGIVSSSLLKTLLQGEEAQEEEVSLASTEMDEHVGNEASRSVAEEEEKIAVEKKLSPQSLCRLLCDRHCGSDATVQVAEGKKRKGKRRGRQSDEEECATKDKQKRKKKQQVSCCPLAASKKCFKHEGVHITLMYSNTE